MPKPIKVLLFVFFIVAASGVSYWFYLRDFGTIVVRQQELDFVRDHLDQLFTSMRLIPDLKEGKVNGLKIIMLKEDSFFHKLKLKKGDVIQTVNGMDFSLESGIKIFEQLKEEKLISVGILRDGKPKNLKYQIVD